MSKKQVLIFLLMAASYSACSQSGKLKEIINDANIPGVQLIYTKDNKTHIINEGLTTFESKQKITSNTIFEAASLSKTVFAYIFFRLYDRNIISLDTPLLHYIGSYERFKSNSPDYAKITARMVLRHSTGLPNWGNDSAVNLIFPPDSCFSYSGEGYLFLQRVLEKMLNKPLNDIAQAEVFMPLHMDNSSYVWSGKFDIVSSFGNSQEQIDRHKNANAAFSLLTNAHDYNIFLRALIAGTGLKTETHQMMFALASAANRFNESEKTADQYIDWALGFGLQQNEKGKAIWHWGDNGSFKCFYIAFPEKNESLVYFTHSQNGLNMAADVVNLFLGSQTTWAMKWLEYGYDSPRVVNAFLNDLKKRGYDRAEEIYHQTKRKNTSFYITEHDLNSVGYMLLQQGKKKEALAIFTLNVQLYPNSSNVYDSQGEAYEDMGDREHAIKSYKRSIELNPKNDNGIEHLKKLEAQK